MTMYSKTAAKISIIVFITTINTLLIAEVYSWFVFQNILPAPAASTQNRNNSSPAFGSAYELDEKLGYRLITKSSNLEEHVQYANKTYRIKKDPKTYRIICVGGSTTIGIDNPKLSYPAILQDMFSYALERCDTKVEVINAGAMGYNSWHTKLRAEKELDILEPDLYIAMDGTNDVIAAAAIDNINDAVTQRNVLTRQINLNTNQTATSSSYFRHDSSLLLDRLNDIKLVKTIRNNVDSFFSADILDQKMKAFGFSENISEFIVERKSKGIDVALVNYGWIVSSNPNDNRKSIPFKFNIPIFQFGRSYIQKSLSDISQKFNTPFVDMQPWADALLHQAPLAYRIFTDELHYTQFFNYFIAREIFEKLRTHPRLTKLAAQCQIPSTPDMDREFSYCIGWGEYYSGFGLPTQSSQAVQTYDTQWHNLTHLDESYDDSGKGTSYKVIAQSDIGSDGTLDISIAPDSCSSHINYFPRIFSNEGMVVVEQFTNGAWNKISELVNYKSTGEWSSIGSRYYFDCRAEDGPPRVRIKLSGKAQLFSYNDNIFFHMQ